MNEINWPNLDSEHLIVYSKQMIEIERNAFSRGMPVESLMEKVGLRLTQWLLKRKNLIINMDFQDFKTLPSRIVIYEKDFELTLLVKEIWKN